MDALQGDIDSLENEKLTLQTRIGNLTKKQMFDNLTRGSGVGSAVGMYCSIFWYVICRIPIITSPVFVAQGIAASGIDSPHLLEEIKSLKSTVGWLRSEHRSQQSKLMKVGVLLLTITLPPYADQERCQRSSSDGQFLSVLLLYSGEVDEAETTSSNSVGKCE